MKDLQSDNEEDVDRALQILTLMSYSTDIEIKEHSGILDSLIRLINRTRSLPRPYPQMIFTQECETASGILFDVSNDTEAYESACASHLSVCTSATGKNIQRKGQIIKILLNLSHISHNKTIIGFHAVWPGLLIEFIQENFHVQDSIEILSNVANYIYISEKCEVIPYITELLFSDNWNIVLPALVFFKRNSLLVSRMGKRWLYIYCVNLSAD